MGRVAGDADGDVQTGAHRLPRLADLDGSWSQTHVDGSPAHGNCSVQGDREATCGRPEVLPRDDKVILTENPVVIDHGTDWTNAGEKIILYRGQRRVVVEKPRIVGPAIKDLGFDKDKPAAEAPAKP